jgi:uncharacterized protein YdhG (YjbR/CyaY superfamily)
VATGTANKRVAKTAPASTVDDYLAAAPKDKRAALRTLRKTIKAAAPKATEGISYGMPTFKYKGERLVYFAYWKDHYALYGIGRSVVDAHVAELRAYQQSKGTIQFPADQPLPERLIIRVVKARLAEIDKTG